MAAEAHQSDFLNVVNSSDEAYYTITTKAAGPQGALPLTPEMLKNWASGDLFGLSLNAGMGWDVSKVNGKQFLILSTSCLLYTSPSPRD